MFLQCLYKFGFTIFCCALYVVKLYLEIKIYGLKTYCTFRQICLRNFKMFERTGVVVSDSFIFFFVEAFLLITGQLCMMVNKRNRS